MAHRNDTDREPGPADARTPRPRWLVVFIPVVTLLLLGYLSLYALMSLLFDGAVAAACLFPWLAIGCACVPASIARSWPVRWRLLIGAALGLGTGSIVILALGAAGWLDRRLWVILLSALAVTGVTVAHRRRILDPPDDHETDNPVPRARVEHLWLLAVPFLVLGALAASHAPGLIWREEGLGYDVLEYHLQVPAEYLASGRITYLPHNVYGSFPLAVEMYYLQAMILLDGTVDTGTSANFIHWGFGLLAVFAAWVVGSDTSRSAGVVAAVLLATVNWLWYLGGLAYNELGMLFYGVTAAGLVLRMARGAPGTPALAGLIAGFACGCKYTAVPMIALPVVAMAGLAGRTAPGRAWQRMGVMTLALLVPLSPWLIRNAVATGNPVFPLAGSWFKADAPGWSENSATRWAEGHRAAPEERSFVGRVSALWRHVPWDSMQRFGPAACLLGLVGLIRRRRTREDQLVLVLLACQLAVWLFATHLYARFAVVLLVPLAILAARAVSRPQRLPVAVLILIVGAGWNLAFASSVFRQESTGGGPASLFYDGRLPGYEYYGVVNHELPEESRVLLVGEARPFYFQRPVDYCVVFNVSPFAERVRTATSPEQITGWLADQGYTHLLVNYLEIDRLRQSRYGFPAEINPALFDMLTRLRGAPHLAVRNDFARPAGHGRYVTLYEVVSP